MFNKTDGVMDSVAGRVQEAFGSAIGDDARQIKGKARRLIGNAEYEVADLVGQVQKSAAKNPVETIVVVAGICFILGAIWARR